jgi:hypothetical protein
MTSIGYYRYADFLNLTSLASRESFRHRAKGDKANLCINHKSAEIPECGDSPQLFVRGQAARQMPAAVAG